ncbi:MAG: hypothetical protein MZV49_16120 [Rhodopseudomonas palustris]|nr:hypothetical protein [Rhodopseudomonas palustris]
MTCATMRFKDFDQRFDADAKSKLAGMSGGLSTRMGAAMRHAGQLSGPAAAKRIEAAVGDHRRRPGRRR